MMNNKLYEKIKNFIKEYGGTLVFVLILILLVTVKLPYQVEMPGGLIDLGNRVTVDGEEAEIEGSFNMAYVSVAQGRIPYILLSFVIPDWDLVPEEDVKYENETIEESNKRDKLYLEQSIAYATVAAMEASGVEYEVSNKLNYVAYVAEEAETDLKIGDNILEVDGSPLIDTYMIREYVNSKNVGDEIVFTVLRDGKEKKVNGKIYEEDGALYVGISVITTFDIGSDIKVEIETKAAESGPSGGMMMALMTYNSITKQDLTHGKKIVGTGTISLDGTVGAIGGVKYKLMGAVSEKADIFLVPADNYEEALDVKKEKGYNIDIVSVNTLQDAIDYLEGL